MEEEGGKTFEQRFELVERVTVRLPIQVHAVISLSLGEHGLAVFAEPGGEFPVVVASDWMLVTDYRRCFDVIQFVEIDASEGVDLIDSAGDTGVAVAETSIAFGFSNFSADVVIH